MSRLLQHELTRNIAKLHKITSQASSNNVTRNLLSCMGYTYRGGDYQYNYLLDYSRKTFLAKTGHSQYCYIPRHQYCTQSQSQETDKLTKLPLHHPVKGDLVYTGDLTKMITLLKGFSVSTSVLGLCCQPFLVTSMGGGVLAYAMMAGMSFFIFASPALIHWMTKRYVTDMYFNQNNGKFVAATLSFFLNRKEIEFIAVDVKVPNVTGPFSSVTIKNKPYFFVPDSFKSKAVYIHMMGYDKPIDDWQLPNDSKKI